MLVEITCIPTAGSSNHPKTLTALLRGWIALSGLSDDGDKRANMVSSFSRSVGHLKLTGRAALERTFLGYLRTSLTFANLGIVLAQLFRLQLQQQTGESNLYLLGIPLASACIGVAISIALLGAFRFWKQQNALQRQRIHVSGWELQAIIVMAFGVSEMQVKGSHTAKDTRLYSLYSFSSWRLNPINLFDMQLCTIVTIYRSPHLNRTAPEMQMLNQDSH